jgi:hypothetical protein
MRYGYEKIWQIWECNHYHAVALYASIDIHLVSI